jgi:hypothetical protein
LDDLSDTLQEKGPFGYRRKRWDAADPVYLYPSDKREVDKRSEKGLGFGMTRQTVQRYIADIQYFLQEQDDATCRSQDIIIIDIPL